METAGSPKFPGNPRDHSPCSLTPAGPGRLSGPRVSCLARPPLRTTTRAPHERRFRGSIAQRLIWLSTLRNGGYPPSRKTRFRLLVRLYRTGLVTRRVPSKGFTLVAILFFRASWRDVHFFQAPRALIPDEPETGLERPGLQRHEHPTEDNLARDPVGQVQRAQEERFFQGCSPCDRRRPAGTGEHRQQRDDHDTDQGVELVDGRARILQLLRMDDDLIQRDALKVRHGWISVSRERSHTETGIQTNQSGRKCYRLPNLPRVRAGPGLLASLSTHR
jgi:hypothetical protein